MLPGGSTGTGRAPNKSTLYGLGNEEGSPEDRVAGTERQGDGIKAKRRRIFQQEKRNRTGQDRTLKDLPGQKADRGL